MASSSMDLGAAKDTGSPRSVDTNWPAFRGGAHGGYSATTANLAWRKVWSIPVPGRGFSSPVVHGNTLYVTTAYPDATPAQVGLVARGTRIGVIAVVLLALLLHLRRSTRNHPGIVFAAVTLTFAALLIAGEITADPRLSHYRRWVILCAGTIACGVVAALACRESGARSVYLALPVLALPAVIALPFPIESSRQSLALVAFGLALTCSMRLLRGPRPATAARAYGGSRIPLMLATVGLVVPWTLLASLQSSSPGSSFQRVVIAFDATTGRRLWTRELTAAPIGEAHVLNSPATPTPIATEAGVFAYFGNEGLWALSHQGEIRWNRRDLPLSSEFGVAISPIFHDGTLVLATGSPTERVVTAMDAHSGRTRWSHKRSPVGSDNGENRTPVIWTDLRGEALVLLQDKGRLTGLRVSDGHSAFTYFIPHADRWGSMVASLAGDGSRVYASAENGIIALDLTDGGVQHLWTAKTEGPDCSSPVVAGDSIYLVTEGGELTGIDARSGQVRSVLSFEDSFYASLVAYRDTVVAVSLSGQIAVVRTGPTPAIVHKLDLGDRMLATPALARGHAFIRTEHALHAFE